MSARSEAVFYEARFIAYLSEKACWKGMASIAVMNPCCSILTALLANVQSVPKKEKNTYDVTVILSIRRNQAIEYRFLRKT